jgi:nucleoside-diphosphate-sugar epimerase
MIGTRLSEVLSEQGYSVTGADIRPNPWNREIDKRTIIADLCRQDEVAKLPSDTDMVIHLAANARVYDLVIRPELARDNYLMLFNVLEFCRQHAINNFLFSSSREVYGSPGSTACAEHCADVRDCESPYAASKIGGEALVHAYQRCYGIDFIITRFSNVYGMYDTSNRVIPRFIRQTLDNEDLVVYGKDKCLDFSYIDDTVAGVNICIRRFSAVKNSTFNISSGRSVPLARVASLVRDSMNGKNTVIIRENRTGEVLQSAVDISRAQNELEYKPNVPVEEGIERSIAWYRNYFSNNPHT